MHIFLKVGGGSSGGGGSGGWRWWRRWRLEAAVATETVASGGKDGGYAACVRAA